MSVNPRSAASRVRASARRTADDGADATSGADVTSGAHGDRHAGDDPDARVQAGAGARPDPGALVVPSVSMLDRSCARRPCAIRRSHHSLYFVPSSAFAWDFEYTSYTFEPPQVVASGLSA